MSERQDLYRYVVEEFAEDYRDGELERREFLRRMVLLGGGVGGARTLLASVGIAGVTTAELAQAQQTPAPVAQAQTPPLVAADDPAVKAEMITFKARDIDQIGYVARPASGASAPGVLVIHENRGLLPHIQDVARRFAKAGYIALAPDLTSKIGGAAKATDTAQLSAYLAQAGGDEHVANLKEYLRVLKATTGVQANNLGVTGYCFGGGLTWRMATEAAELKAAVPFYGSAPDTAKVPAIKAAVLGIYAGNDARINAGIAALEEALKAAKTKYQFKMYDGANHGFHNDTGANFKKDAAEDAFKMTLDWFKTHLV